MSKYKIGEDSPIPKFIYLKIRRRDGVESLTTLEEGEFKVPIDGCISGERTRLFIAIVKQKLQYFGHIVRREGDRRN